MEPHHPFALALSIDQQRDHVFERGRAGTDPFARSRSQIGDGRTDQGIRPDQHIGLVQTFSRAKGEQVWSTRACSDETDNVTQLRWPDGSGKGCFRPYSHQSPIMPSAPRCNSSTGQCGFPHRMPVEAIRCRGDQCADLRSRRGRGCTPPDTHNSWPQMGASQESSVRGERAASRTSPKSSRFQIDS